MIKELFHIWNMSIFLDTSQKEDILEWIWRILVTDSRSPINHLDQEFIYIYIPPRNPNPRKKHGAATPRGQNGKCQARQAQLLERYGPLEVNCEAQQRKLDAQMDELQQESRFFSEITSVDPRLGQNMAFWRLWHVDIYWYYCYLVLNRS